MAVAFDIRRTDIQWIDIRSPREFKTGTIPGAVNLPLFLDETYEIVGTAYKQKGPQEAKRVAMKFVAERLPAIYEAFLEIEALGKPMVMFCARGGMRSKTLKNMLSNLGHDLERLEGGYKAYRQVVLEEMEKTCASAKMVVIHGMTGVGKTQVLKALAQSGSHVVDIEGISAHRGSMLGRIGLPEQPNQREFEHLLLEALLKAEGSPVFVEAESKRLGRNTLPECFMVAMRNGKHVDLTASTAFRREVLIQEYAGCDDYVTEMVAVLDGFRKALGNEVVERLKAQLLSGELGEVAEYLMVHYYDSKYLHASRGISYDLAFEIQSIEAAARRLADWAAQLSWTEALETVLVDLRAASQRPLGESDLDALLRPAADSLRAGQTVAFPTETVYGIGADAMSPVAVAKIFKAKGRPSDNPLIVHIAEQSALDALVAKIPPVAEQLMEAFWPGALTLILPKADAVPISVTAGLKTIAVRMPSHPVARRLIELSGCAVAAPSANLSGKPSPTCGEDVLTDLYGRVSVIVLGDDAQIGLESTVVDVTGEEPVVLRPGGVTLEAIRAVVGCGRFDEKLNQKLEGDEQPRSPGMKYTHYAPEAEVTVFCGPPEAVREAIRLRVEDGMKRGIKPGVMTVSEVGIDFEGAVVRSLGSYEDPQTAASLLFKTLREFDREGAAEVYAAGFEEEGIGKAIMNRLIKAAGHRVVSLSSK